VIKFFKYLLISLLSLFILLNIGVYVLLNVPSVQREITRISTLEVQKLLHTRAKIGSVRFRFFNKLELNDVWLANPKGATVLDAKKISVGLNILELLKNRLIINTVQIYSFHVYIEKETPESKTNIQFILDALKADSTKKSNPLAEVQIKSIIIRRGNLNFDIRSIPYKFGQFNASHIRLRNLLANISLHTFTNDSADILIRRFAFEENSGFAIRKLAVAFTANRKRAEFRNLELFLPRSELKFRNFFVDYAKVDSIHPFVDAAKFNVDIPLSALYPGDFAAFVPAFRYYVGHIDFSASAGGAVNSLLLRKLELSSDSRLQFRAEMQLEGISDPKNAYIYGKIKELKLQPGGLTEIVRNISKNRDDVSSLANRLGLIQFTGELSGYFSDLVAYGRLRSALGDVQTDVKISQDTLLHRTNFSGQVGTSGFNLGKLLNKDNLGQIGFNLKLNGYKAGKYLPQGKVSGEIALIDFNKYQYKNIVLKNGLFEGTRFEGSLEMNDANGYFMLNGKIDSNPKRPFYKLSMRAINMDLNALNLYRKHRNAKLSFALTADLSGALPDFAIGSVVVDSLSYKTADDTLFYRQISVISTSENGMQRLKLQSPLVSGNVAGNYKLSSLPASFTALATRYLPALTPGAARQSVNNQLRFDFTISNSEKLSAMFGLPVTFIDESVVSGEINDVSQQFKLQIMAPQLYWGKRLLTDALLLMGNNKDNLELSARLITQNKKKDNISLSLQMSARNNEAQTKFNWSNSALRTYSGEINMHSRLEARAKGSAPAVFTDLQPGKLILNDTTWYVGNSFLKVDSGRIEVRNFMVHNARQFLKMDGKVSAFSGDTLSLSLKNVNLDYIFNTLSIKNVHFGGVATGDFVLNNLLKSPVFLTDNLKISDFSFNGTRFGQLNLFSRWDANKSGILMSGTIHGYLNNKTRVNGYIFPTKDSIAMSFNADRINVLFLRNYMGGFMKDLSGFASGNVMLYGKFSKLNVAGDVKMHDFSFGVEYLSTRYSISDSLHLRHNLIYFKNIVVLDKDKNSAIATGRVTHESFSNWHYSIDANTRNFLVYNAQSSQNSTFYGPVYGSGNLSIAGDEKVTNINAGIQSGAGTKFMVSLSSQMTASDYDFISFRTGKTGYQPAALSLWSEGGKAQLPEPQRKSSPHITNINLMVDINPVSSLSLVMDPVAGDVIETNGSGNMRLAYSSNKDVQLFGTYTIDRGNYAFSFQNFIKKRFAIHEGSTVVFRGDPYNADLGLKAQYTTTADLADLNESFTTDKDISRTNTQVQCLLDISGDMRKPDIRFDLNLPNNTEEVNRRVKSIVNTEDMMARQVFYLLALNRFYVVDYLNSGTANKNNELSSIASATISSQFNNILSQITDKVNIGTNLKMDNTSAYNKMEVEVALSSQLLNNRLIVNGNLGYRDNTSNKATFIGDFDFEYKLTKSGGLRIKGYNRSNDRYSYLKSSLTTQGLGIIYKRDVDSFFELFRKRYVKSK